MEFLFYPQQRRQQGCHRPCGRPRHQGQYRQFNEAFGERLQDALQTLPWLMADMFEASPRDETPDETPEPEPWNHCLHLKGFKPEEISIEEKDDIISVHAKHEEKDGDDVDMRQMTRHVKLPDDVDKSTLRSIFRCGHLILRAERKTEKPADEPVASTSQEGAMETDSTTEKQTVVEANESIKDESAMESAASKSPVVAPTPEPEASHDTNQTVATVSEPFKLTYNLAGFDPSEVSIRTEDNHLVVSAEHKEEDDDGLSVHRVFKRRTLLPNGTNIQEMKSVLSPDGKLTVAAPPKLENLEQTVPIEYIKPNANGEHPLDLD